MRLNLRNVAVTALATRLALGDAQIITIDPTARQTLTSFGASGAWWPNDLALFPTAVQQNLSHLLFSEDGLHLTSYRYNLGAYGGNDNETVNRSDGIVESFLLRNGSYDWSKDQPGVSFLKAAQRYAVPYITFFVNAAPSAIADNGAACGWSMTAAKVPAFAAYIKTVLSHWVSHGIDIRYISPMNEPDYTHGDCGQEGMAVESHLRPSVIQSIRAALDASPAKHVDIIADETSQTITAEAEDPSWFNATRYISNIAVHNYDYPSDAALATYYQSVLDLTDNNPPPIKLTETCCSTSAGNGAFIFGSQYDPTMINALIVARYVWQYLTIAQAQSIDWWSAVATLPCSPSLDPDCAPNAIYNTSGFNSGLYSIDPKYNQSGDHTLYPTKRATLLRHLAHFHRPGSVRLDVPQPQLPKGVNAIASANSVHDSDDGSPWRSQTWSLLFMNNQTATPYNLSLQAPSGCAHLKHLVRTTDQLDWDVVHPLPAIRDGVVDFELPALSLVTLVFST